jgi:O-antigen ligase
MRSARAHLAPDGALLALGAALTLLAALQAARGGALLSLGPLLGLLAFMTLLGGFVTAPHVTVAFTIVYFTLLPALKTLVTPQLGPTKDIMIGAAVLATGIRLVTWKRLRADRPLDQTLLVTTVLLMGLYVVDVGAGISGGGRFGLEWFHGVRLVWEPFLLLLFALYVREPRRTLRWAVVGVIVGSVVAALYGLAQQMLGSGWLVAHGYSYGVQVRTIGSHLRSFGTLDQPFDYAAVLAAGMTGILLWARRGVLTAAAGTVIAAGLGVSFVRAAAISSVALLALLLARKRHTTTALLLLGAVAAAGIAFLLAATRPTPGRVVQAGPSLYLTLNGRTSSWRDALGTPRNWAFGRGVGLYGTAAQRAQRSSALPTSIANAPTRAADSGYLATLSDVGLVGLALLLALFGRIVALFRRAIARGEQLGWFGVGLVTVMLLDATLRSSFTGFPTADIVFLLIGLSVAATLPRREPAQAGS